MAPLSNLLSSTCVILLMTRQFHFLLSIWYSHPSTYDHVHMERLVNKPLQRLCPSSWPVSLDCQKWRSLCDPTSCSIILDSSDCCNLSLPSFQVWLQPARRVLGSVATSLPFSKAPRRTCQMSVVWRTKADTFIRRGMMTLGRDGQGNRKGSLPRQR
ncbi:hypothetical protein B0O80DRAFT_121266 [Mortierella sp. GBAus27b]|nr:hypothetical protein B0O80DRAFT_121266 [Mortierella sp. GBAus27b]